VTEKPRYQTIANEFRARVYAGDFHVGSQLPLEGELAGHYGVARGTVRKALAVLEGEGLVRRERGKGTFVRASSGVHGPVRPVVYVGEYEGHLFGELYVALSSECQRAGVPISAYDPQQARTLAEASERIAALSSPHSAVIASVHHWRGPFGDAPLPTAAVFIHFQDRPQEALNGSPGVHISMDPDTATRTATEYVIGRGHRKLAYVGSIPAAEPGNDVCFPLPDHKISPYRGFLLALADAGLGEHRALGSFAVEDEAEELFAEFLQHLDGWPTAVVCHSDYRAVLLCHAADRVGIRVPEELSIIGIGNTSWCRAVRPRLTTVSYNEPAVALLAAQLAQVPVPDFGFCIAVTPHVIEHDSVLMLTESDSI